MCFPDNIYVSRCYWCCYAKIDSNKDWFFSIVNVCMKSAAPAGLQSLLTYFSLLCSSFSFIIFYNLYVFHCATYHWLLQINLTLNINLLFELASLVHLIEIINHLRFNTSVHFWINNHDCSCLLNYFLNKLLRTFKSNSRIFHLNIFNITYQEIKISINHQIQTFSI